MMITLFLLFSCLLLLLKSVGAIPCNEEYVPQPTLGYFCIQCYPHVGCCMPPPQCKALDDLTGTATEGPVSASLMDR
jgi:hypothetical protein